MASKPNEYQWLPSGVFVTVSAFVVYGYWFPSSNHFMEVPPILAMLQPDLFQNDYYVQEMSRFNVRTPYSYMIYGLAHLGLGLPLSYFFSYLVSFAGLISGLWFLGRHSEQSSLTSVILIFLGLVSTSATLGDTSLFVNTPVPQSYAMPLSVWGVYMCYKNRWTTAYTLFGAACLFQFLVGLLPALMFLPSLLHFTIRAKALRTCVQSLVILALFVASIYVPMRFSGISSTGLLTDEEFVHIYGHVRHPQHIIPSSWDAGSYLNFFSFLTGGLLCLFWSRSISPEDQRKSVLAIVACVLALTLGYVFVEVFPIAFFAKLQLARTTPFAQLIVLKVISSLVVELYKRGRSLEAVAIMTTPLLSYGGVLLAGFACLFWAHDSFFPGLVRISDKPSDSGFAVRAAAIFACVAAAPMLSLVELVLKMIRTVGLFFILSFPLILGEAIPEPGKKRFITWLLALVCCTFLALVASGIFPGKPSTVITKGVNLNWNPKDDVTLLAHRFRDRSSRQALVLVPPSVMHFRLFSERSVVVDFKSFPYTDRGIHEWKARMEAVLGQPLPPRRFRIALDDMFARRSGDELVNVANKYGAGFLLSRWHADIKGSSVVDRQGDWTLWEINVRE